MLAVVSPGGDCDLPMDGLETNLVNPMPLIGNYETSGVSIQTAGIIAAVENWVADREKTNNRKT